MQKAASTRSERALNGYPFCCPDFFGDYRLLPDARRIASPLSEQGPSSNHSISSTVPIRRPLCGHQSLSSTSEGQLARYTWALAPVTPNRIFMTVPTLAKALEEAKDLLNLCRAGRLYEIEKWIAAGRPLEIPTQKYE